MDGKICILGHAGSKSTAAPLLNSNITFRVDSECVDCNVDKTELPQHLELLQLQVTALQTQRAGSSVNERLAG